MASNSFLVTLVCVFSFCGEPIEVLQSTWQQSVYGQRGLGGNIEYSIELVAAKSSKKLIFQNIVVDGTPLDVKIQNTSNEIVGEFSKGDTLRVFASLPLSSEDLKKEKGKAHRQADLHYRYKRDYSKRSLRFYRELGNNYK